MTLLRRAHREVYRVYSEEEFFACVDHDGRSERAGAAGERRMHRVAGATVLLAATGAMGGLIAVTSLSTATGARRRAGASLLAATRSLRPSVHALRVARNTTRVMLLRRERAPRGAAAARHVAVANATGTVAVREQDTPIAATTPVQPVRAVASTAATSQPSGQEFGFER
jgi:hypothetical protein